MAGVNAHLCIRKDYSPHSLPPLYPMRTDRIGQLLTLELLEEMDTLWPDRCPSPTADERTMLVECAKRDVINVLWERFKRATAPSPSQELPSVL